MLVFSMIVLGVLGSGGAKCAVQTGLSNWNSIYNLTYLQDYFLTMIGGYIGSLFILTLSMLVSAKSHSTVFAITVPFALVCVPPFLGKIAVLSRGMSLFPDKLLSISKSLEDFSLYQLGGKVMGAVTVLGLSLIHIFFLTACDMDEDIMKGFDCGADDYMTKPFNVKILMQRIRCLLYTSRCV